jgi:ABC-type transporter Mla subunit MlaD
MADGFSVERAVAQDLARSLTSIRTAMNDFAKDAVTGVTGAPAVEAALERFYRESSDNREALDKLLDRASKMMQALADGSGAVDQGLADALTTTGAAPGPSHAPTPPQSPGASHRVGPR